MRRIVVLIAVLAMVAAACGGGSDDGSDSTETPATSGATAIEVGGDAANGEALYNGSCMACHGPGGEGIEGLGKPWVGSDFINGSSDAEMITFLQVGRASDDPLNSTGIAMLPRGGNPSLTDSDLADLVAYMRTLNT
jgi:disulfide bond formation protein DsbB